MLMKVSAEFLFDSLSNEAILYVSCSPDDLEQVQVLLIIVSCLEKFKVEVDLEKKILLQAISKPESQHDPNDLINARIPVSLHVRVAVLKTVSFSLA